MTPTGIKLEELFAGVEMRVEMRATEGKPPFAVLGAAPTTFGAEVEICRMQYRPHAMAFAALPEIIDAFVKSGLAVKSFMARDVGRAHPPEADVAAEAIMTAIMKAETYGA